MRGPHSTGLYRLDVLDQPRKPSDARIVHLQAFDTTGTRQRILRGDGHNYLTYLLSVDRIYELVDEETGFRKIISFQSKPVSQNGSQFAYVLNCIPYTSLS